jgi:3-oxoacyl-(acyl-carrier-protein) synthase III
MNKPKSLIAPVKPAGARLTGLGTYRPKRVVPNSELVAAIDSSDEWIRERSGIKERRIAGETDTVVSMGAAASSAALIDANTDPAEIDLVICTTATHDKLTPHASALIATEVGATRAGAHDLNAACSGFSYGIAEAFAQITSGNARKVLLVGSERMHDFIDTHDRTTAFLFGDGAGAVVVEASAANGIGPVIWGSDGSQSDAIKMSTAWHDYKSDLSQPFPHVQMAGQQVFRWAVGTMAPIALAAIREAGVTPSDLKAFIPHQANMRITDALVREMKLPEHVVIARDIEVSGNTTAATIPLAMAALRENGEVSRGDLALLLGFGGGLAYSAQVVCLP